MKLFNWAIGWCCVGALLLISWVLNDTLIFANDRRLQQAVENGDASAVFKAVRKGALIAISIAGSETPLITLPIQREQPDVLKAMLSSKKPLPDSVANTALVAAFSATSTDALSLLLAHRYKPGRPIFTRWLSAEKPDSSHPHIQALRQHHKGFHLLLAGSLEQALDSHNFALAEKVLAIHPVALFDLFSRPCCPNPRDGGVSITGVPYPLPKTGPMQRAATIPASEPTLTWLSKRGIAVDTKDSTGKTALMWAALYRRSSNISTLLRLGADPNIQDNEGRTALIYALMPYSTFKLHPQQRGGRYRNMLNVLGLMQILAAGADPELADNYQLSALDYSVRMSNGDETSPLAQALSVSEPTKRLWELQRNTR